jgi:hypothetical protein
MPIVRYERAVEAFANSLCRRCSHLRLVEGARSVFLLCAEGNGPRYPAQPVGACGRFTLSPTLSPAGERETPRDDD